MNADDSDSELRKLIQRARGGDDAALGQILEGHRDWLRIAAEKELDDNMAARIDASDIVQQTFLSACNRINQFNGGTSGEFIAWITKIQEHNIQDAVRQHVAARKRSASREQGQADPGEVADSEVSTPSQRVMRVERSADLNRALEILPEDQREAVRLRHLEGWSLAQLADHFGRSKDAVASLLKRGIENLRNQIQDDT